MDAKEIKENFIKHYSGDDNGLKCYKSCCGIVLYGAGLEDSGLCVGGLTLSVDTSIVIREKDDKIFDIICADTDIKYECDIEKLNSFTGDKFSKEMFNACAILKGNLCGAEILVEYSVNDRKFKRPLTSLMSGLGIFDKGKVPDFETVKYILDKGDEQSYSFLPAELYGRKNTLISRKNDGRWEYLPFNLTGLKMVISYTDLKGIDIKKILSEDDMKKYSDNETKRAELIKKEKGITEEVGKIIKASAYELFDMLGKSAEKLKEMYKISEETGLCVLVVPLYNYYGVCAFLKDEDVDAYCDMISKEYQKKVGIMPTLCICDSDDSGVEI